MAHNSPGACAEVTTEEEDDEADVKTPPTREVQVKAVAEAARRWAAVMAAVAAARLAMVLTLLLAADNVELTTGYEAERRSFRRPLSVRAAANANATHTVSALKMGMDDVKAGKEVQNVE